MAACGSVTFTPLVATCSVQGPSDGEDVGALPHSMRSGGAARGAAGGHARPLDESGSIDASQLRWMADASAWEAGGGEAPSSVDETAQ